MNRAHKIALIEIQEMRYGMVVNWFKLFTLFEVIAWGKRHIAKIFLVVALLGCFGVDQVPEDPPITYTVNGYTIVRPSEMGPLTGTVNNPMLDPIPLTGAKPAPAKGPGHDYGAIGILSNPVVSVSPAGAIRYTINGYTIVRRSELGPLTGLVYNPSPAAGPGHDYGAIEP